MTSRAGGGDWGEEPTANIRIPKAHVIRRQVTPVEKRTQELAKLEVDALLAQTLVTRRVSETHVTIEVSEVDDLPAPIAAAAANRHAHTTAKTPKLGLKRLDLAEGSQVEVEPMASATMVAAGTNAMAAIDEPAPVDRETHLALGTDPMIPIDRPVARTATREYTGPGPLRDLAIGFGFGIVLLAGAVLAAFYAL